MQAYEVMATVQRLGFIATVISKTDLGALAEQLGHAEAVAPLFSTTGAPDARINAIRRFATAAKSFQDAALEYAESMKEAGVSPEMRRLAIAAPGIPGSGEYTDTPSEGTP